MKRFLTTAILLFTVTLLSGQDSTMAPVPHWVKYRDGFRIEPVLMWQMWGLFSHGQETFQQASGNYQQVDNRLNFQLRRARFGFRAQPFENLRFTLMAAYDVLGRDANSGTQGGTNNLALPDIGIWDAYSEWRIIPKKEYLFLVAGYFRPQFSRESITGAWAVPSLEKSMSQNYLRKHLTGFGPGRTTGINLGGLWRSSGDRFGINYNLGLFTPQYIAFGGQSIGNAFSPLWTGRVVLELGDPESKTYKINYDLNFYGKRKGLSLALAAAYQGKTDLFDTSYGLQTDILWNHGPFNFDAEYNRLYRTGLHKVSGAPYRSGYSTGHIRGSTNLVIGGKFLLEPTAMMMFFEGALGEQGQAEAAALRLSSGGERAYDIGINWHLQEKKLKLLLHYVWRKGNPGSAHPGNQVNAFFSEPGIGAIQRGNWLGLGLHVIL